MVLVPRTNIYATNNMYWRMSCSRVARFFANTARPQAMVCSIGQTPVDATELAVWSRLDNPVPGNGVCSLARLAAKQLDRCSDATLPGAVVTQRWVVSTVLRIALTGRGFC